MIFIIPSPNNTQMKSIKSMKSHINKIPKIIHLNDEYKMKIIENAYIGKKGYTIHKSDLTDNDMDFIRTDLLLKPEISGPQYGPAADEAAVAFPVYRENSNKMYLPRFYGIERYGVPMNKPQIDPGIDIDVTFNAERPLRDYQENIVGIYMKHVVGNAGGAAGAILEVPCGRGKTIMALNIISRLKKKTLILVHKEFLMNQWIERISEFIPCARVGKIQADVYDVENKDIVIGMIQTLYKRDYDYGMFGLTIVDEVHRIGSEEFSKTLLKTITPYMLGISATVERKDGLTKLLFMFIGPKIYEEVRKNDDPVCVRCINYISKDPQFNTVEYDFRGNTKYSTMITKLCEFGPRTDFIVRVLMDLRSEHPQNQIMVLGHNRSLLKYLYEAIQHKKVGTVGYYVGGMKAADLQKTEGQEIVLATYAMAAEALDIKTLATLVMVTPKTDIIQSVGRILRVKHEHPIIVDIVDSHDSFRNQWKQRRAFYKKCNYKIITKDSETYVNMLDCDNWKVLYNGGSETDGKCNGNGNDEKKVHKCMIDISDIDFTNKET